MIAICNLQVRQWTLSHRHGCHLYVAIRWSQSESYRISQVSQFPFAAAGCIHFGLRSLRPPGCLQLPRQIKCWIRGGWTGHPALVTTRPAQLNMAVAHVEMRNGHLGHVGTMFLPCPSHGDTIPFPGSPGLWDCEDWNVFSMQQNAMDSIDSIMNLRFWWVLWLSMQSLVLSTWLRLFRCSRWNLHPLLAV